MVVFTVSSFVGNPVSKNFIKMKNKEGFTIKTCEIGLYVSLYLGLLEILNMDRFPLDTFFFFDNSVREVILAFMLYNKLELNN